MSRASTRRGAIAREPVRRRVARLAGVACVAGAALAASTPARAQDCGAAATQQAAHACENERRLAAQATMAEALRTLSAALAPGSRDALRREQKAWLAWRTAACDYEASGVAGGSAASTVRARCASRLAGERAAELKRRIDDCLEGDLACPATR